MSDDYDPADQANFHEPPLRIYSSKIPVPKTDGPGEGTFFAGQLNTIDELMAEISYSLDNMHHIIKRNDGIFQVNKLQVGDGWTEYKGTYTTLAPGLYDVLCSIYEIIEKTRLSQTDTPP